MYTKVVIRQQKVTTDEAQVHKVVTWRHEATDEEANVHFKLVIS